MLEWIKQKRLEWIFAVALTIFSAMIYNYYAVRRDIDSRIKTQIEQKADKVDVEKANAELRDEMIKGDDNVKQLLEQHAKETNERTLSMDRKLDILLSRTK